MVITQMISSSDRRRILLKLNPRRCSVTLCWQRVWRIGTIQEDHSVNARRISSVMFGFSANDVKNGWPATSYKLHQRNEVISCLRTDHYSWCPLIFLWHLHERVPKNPYVHVFLYCFKACSKHIKVENLHYKAGGLSSHTMLHPPCSCQWFFKKKLFRDWVKINKAGAFSLLQLCKIKCWHSDVKTSAA